MRADTAAAARITRRRPPAAAALAPPHAKAQLYRDALRLALYLSHKNGTRSSPLIAEVRATFRANAKETDPQRIEAQRRAAVSGLHSFLMSEATERAKAGADPFAPES